MSISLIGQVHDAVVRRERLPLRWAVQVSDDEAWAARWRSSRTPHILATVALHTCATHPEWHDAAYARLVQYVAGPHLSEDERGLFDDFLFACADNVSEARWYNFRGRLHEYRRNANYGQISHQAILSLEYLTALRQRNFRIPDQRDARTSRQQAYSGVLISMSRVVMSLHPAEMLSQTNDRLAHAFRRFVKRPTFDEVIAYTQNLPGVAR